MKGGGTARFRPLFWGGMERLPQNSWSLATLKVHGHYMNIHVK